MKDKKLKISKKFNNSIFLIKKQFKMQVKVKKLLTTWIDMKL